MDAFRVFVIAEQSPLMVRLKSVFDVHRNIPLDGRQYRFGMQYSGAKMCQLSGLVNIQFGDCRRFGNNRRVGSEKAIHIGPDLDLIGFADSTDDGGGVIGPAAPQSSNGTRFGAADETLHHRDLFLAHIR